MQKVETLDLSHNKLGDKSAEAIAKGISESMSLRNLDISWNNFRPKGICILAKGIKVSGQEITLMEFFLIHQLTLC